MLSSLGEMPMKIPQKLHFVPSDLLEYPVINYFQYRNDGILEDIPLTPKVIKAYLPYYKKDPRKIFTPAPLPLKIHFSKPIERSWLKECVGAATSPYVPIIPEVLKGEKFEPVRKMIMICMISYTLFRN